MSKFIQIFVFFTVLLVVFGSCRHEGKKVAIDGQEIAFVKGDTLFTKSGGSLVMDSVKKVYYLVRHAEKDSVPADNPALTEKGMKRATLLADILRATRVDAIYSTFYTRTLFTVDSLADIKAMSILPYDAKKLRELIDDIQADESQKAVVIVGHSNNIPSLTNSLAGKEIFNKNFDDEEYNNFIIVVEKHNGQKEVILLKYNIEE
jgi:broad specificity phosphatase PhoE